MKMNQAEPQNGTYKAPKSWVSMQVLYYQQGHAENEPHVGWITSHTPMEVQVNYIVPNAGSLNVAYGVLHISDPRYKRKMDRGAWDYTQASKAQINLDIESTDYEKVEKIKRIEETTRNMPPATEPPKPREIVDFLVAKESEGMRPGQIRDALKAELGVPMNHTKIMFELRREAQRVGQQEEMSTDATAN
jgi:hypothetical protein